MTTLVENRAATDASHWTSSYVLLPAALAIAAMLASEAPISPTLCWDVAWTAAAVSALVGMVLARGSTEGPSRARGTLWTAAAGCLLLGQLASDLFTVIGSPPSPNLADVGYLAFAVLVIASMLPVPWRPSGSRSVRVVVAAETLSLIAAATALTFAELWSDAAHSALPLLPRLSALAYPAVFVSAAVLTLQEVVGGSLRRNRSPASMLVLGGIVAEAVAFILWSHQLLRESYIPGGTVLDPLWALGLIAIGTGGLLSARRPEIVVAADEPSHHGALLPAAMFVLLTAALVRGWFSHTAAGAAVTLAAGLLLCGVALTLRGTLLERGLRVLLARERVARTELAARESELAGLNERLVEDSRRDALTGLRNRRALSDDLPSLEAIERERGERTALALCDIDHFKSYNDHLGHLAGDQALRAIASTVRSTLRAGDIAYRFGGEELLLVLRDTTARDALAAAERVRIAVERAGLPHPAGVGGTLTVSIGVAHGSGEAGQLLSCADGALYEAKHAGRNRVVAATGSQAQEATGRRRIDLPEEPVPRHLRSMLTISRAAVSGRGAVPVLEALAETIHSELSFAVVAVNLLDEARRELCVVVVRGDEEARKALLGSTNAWSEWAPLMVSEHARCGAVWLPAGSHEWSEESPTWTPLMTAAPGSDSWQPEDMLLLPLRGASGEILGVVSIDEPLSGRRLDDAELNVLMAVADHAGLALEQSQRDTVETSAMREQSQELRLAAVMLLAETVDLRDPGTARHSRTVGIFARGTAEALGLAPERVERIHAAGVLHDLGKLGIADAILLKPGPLDVNEWREIQRHAEIGARILEHAGMRDIASWVRAHHERIDGNGYPNRLPAEEIALEPRILAVADAYEAMTADRPYRSAMPASAARQELVRCTGTQFDQAVVGAFLSALPEVDSGAAELPSAA